MVLVICVKMPSGLRILIRRSCNAVLELEHFAGAAEVSVTFVDNAEIARLNAQYRNNPNPTDVLSFPLGQDGAYDKNRRALYDGLTKLGFECVFPQGAFYMWVKAPGGDDKAFAEMAKRRNILLVPGTSFACPGYARLAYCVSPDMIERSMAAFSELAKDCGNTFS